MTEKHDIHRLQRDIRDGCRRAGKDLKWLARQCQAADEDRCDQDPERYYERFKKDFQRGGAGGGRKERLAGYLRILSETREFRATAPRNASRGILPRAIETGMERVSRQLDDRIIREDADEE